MGGRDAGSPKCEIASVLGVPRPFHSRQIHVQNGSFRQIFAFPLHVDSMAPYYPHVAPGEKPIHADTTQAGTGQPRNRSEKDRKRSEIGRATSAQKGKNYETNPFWRDRTQSEVENASPRPT
jgi:hypothetical protein